MTSLVLPSCEPYELQNQTARQEVSTYALGVYVFNSLLINMAFFFKSINCKAGSINFLRAFKIFYFPIGVIYPKQTFMQEALNRASSGK